MELDTVQAWVDIVKKQCEKLHKEVELHLHLIGNIL